MERMYPVEIRIFVRDFYGFLCSRGVRIAANSHVVVRKVRKIGMERDWFGRICVVLLCRSGPPVSSLFRLCRFSCIACRLCNR